MPDDTNDQPASRFQDKFKKVDDSLQRLTEYVQRKAAEEDDEVIASFKAVAQACRIIFSKIVIAQQSNSVAKNALANFLDVLSSVEAYRVHIAKKADEALTWNVYYQDISPKQTLSSQEASKLDTIIKGKDEWRIVYMKILKKAIALDLYYLFISKPWFASDFMVRLLEYNPHMFTPLHDGDKPRSPEFMHYLSKDEIKLVKAITKQTLQFVKDSHIWLEENFGDDILLGLYSQEFQEIHPPPADLQRLESLLHYYLKHISDTHRVFTSIIPNKLDQNDDP